MKILIAGGTGQIGRRLTRRLAEEGYDVVVVSRNPAPEPIPVRWMRWDGRTAGVWQKELETCGVVINLAGRSVNCRYNAGNRKEIRDSRLDSVRVLAEAISNCKNPPALWLQMSTATIYRHSLKQPNDETTGDLGGGEPGAADSWDFSVEVAKAWEAAVSSLPATRVVKLRTAMVMAPTRDGVFDHFLRLVRWGLGGVMGNGDQWVSWIHEKDFARAIVWLIRNPNMEGVVNVCSPFPLRNREFLEVLRKAWGIPWGFGAPSVLLELGAWMMRTESELVMKSRYVIPGRLQAEGFEFEFPKWSEAAEDLCRRWKESQISAE